MKTRIIKKGNLFYPQFFKERSLFRSEGWCHFMEKSDSCFLTGSGGYDYEVSVATIEEAMSYINEKYKNSEHTVVWQSDDD